MRLASEILTALGALAQLTSRYRGNHTVHERVLSLMRDVAQPYPRIVENLVYLSDAQAPHPLIDWSFRPVPKSDGDGYQSMTSGPRARPWSLILNEEGQWLVELPGEPPKFLSEFKAQVVGVKGRQHAVLSSGSTTLVSSPRGLVLNEGITR